MIGHVDDSQRALLTISIGKSEDDPGIDVTVWIDTAFDGHLVCSQELIDQFDLAPLVETEAILADGSKVVLETFLCYVNWFTGRIPVQVIANDGRFPLLETGLLEGRTLHIEYARKSMTLD